MTSRRLSFPWARRGWSSATEGTRPALRGNAPSGFQAVPGPVGNRQARRHGGSLWVVDMHVSDRPLHVVAYPLAEGGVVGKMGVIRRLHETGNEAISQTVLRFHSGVEGQQAELSIR